MSSNLFQFYYVNNYDNKRIRLISELTCLQQTIEPDYIRVQIDFCNNVKLFEVQ